MTEFSILHPHDLTFGRGCAAQAMPKILAFGRRVLLVRGRSARWCDELRDGLRDAGAEVTEVFCSGEPSLSDVTEAVEVARAATCEVIVAVGGGSPIDLAKAVAALVPNSAPATDYITGGRPLDTAPLPFVAIPTTAGTGAEVTRNAVIWLPERSQKISLRDTAMIADVALVDPALTDGTPRAVTFGSGLDAVVQVIEPYLCNRANAYTDALCRQAIPMGLRALAHLAEGECESARDDLALVSLFGGLALTNAGLGAVHGLAGVIGGRMRDAPHGLLCGRLLCATLQVNLEQSRAQGASVTRLEEVLGWLAEVTSTPPGQAVEAFARLLNTWGVPRLDALETLSPDMLASIAEDARASSSMKANPVPLRVEDLAQIVTLSADFQRETDDS